MQWDELLGHSQQRDWFQVALARNRLASSFLFVGANGIGKRTFAKLLAQSLLCRCTPDNQLAHCGSCDDCVQVAAGTHPDLIQIQKPADKAFIPVDLFIGPPEKRMREGLCHDISLRPFSGRRKIAIVDDADSLNVEGANCLLKTLEEPPAGSMLILIGTSLPRQLPTIRSRCQSILFRPLEAAQLAELLLREQMVDTHAAADELASQAGGSIAEARQISDPELREFRATLYRMLSRHPIPIVDLAKQSSLIVDGAGKDARAKRDRMKLIFRFAADFYRAVSIRLSVDEGRSKLLPPGIPNSEATDVAAKSSSEHWPRGTAEAIRCWQECLSAMEHVDRNANQASLLEAWAAEMASTSGC